MFHTIGMFSCVCNKHKINVFFFCIQNADGGHAHPKKGSGAGSVINVKEDKKFQTDK